jgi:two-component system sensor kinase FixL
MRKQSLRGGTKVKNDADYRRVVAGLQDCEERYDGLLESIDDSGDSRLATALKALKNEVRNRRRLEAQLLTAVDAERQRIGQDLHDDLCQHLGATALIAASLGKRINSKRDPELSRDLAKIPALITEAIENCRNLARGLHPVTLASKGLPAALEELTVRVPANVKFRWPRTERISLEPSVALHLYRIAEESVANAVKHSGANNITIELDLVEGAPILTITDDGRGFSKRSNKRGMGLFNMQYRANAIGGELTFPKRDDGGTRVCCKLPVPKRALKAAPTSQAAI